MRLTVSLLVAAILFGLLFAGSVVSVPLAQAEMIAEALAPEVGLEKAVLWDKLNVILNKHMGHRLFLVCTPWLVMIILSYLRLRADRKGR